MTKSSKFSTLFNFVLICQFYLNTSNSHFRYTGSPFLGCAFFVACCNISRTSWETKKNLKIELQKKVHRRICVRDITFLIAQPLFYMSLFVAFFMYSFLLPKRHTCWMSPIKIHNIAMGGILCYDIMTERSKVWKSLAI